MTKQEELLALLQKKKEEQDNEKTSKGLASVMKVLAKDPETIRGERGFTGEKGEKGDKGDKGEQGIQGIQGISGLNGRDGKDGVDGLKGKDGVNGENGYTPVKGKDYFDGVNGKDGKNFDEKKQKTFNDELQFKLGQSIQSLDKMNVKSVSINGVKIGNFNDINFISNGTATVTASNNSNQGVDVIISATGGSGGTTFYTETPVGLINSSNKTYTVANNITSVLNFAINGQYLHLNTDFTFTGNTITMVNALDSSLSVTGFTIVYA
jgi:hypothetical protein